jgi:hypothetical protein
MPGPDPKFHTFHDPYFRQTPEVVGGVVDHPGQPLHFVQSSRPIILTQRSEVLDLVVNVPADKDMVVYGDVVTIKGPIQVRLPQPQKPPPYFPAADVGGSLIILARRLETDTAMATDGKWIDAKLDLAGDRGWTSAKPWTGPPHNGVGDTGTPGTRDGAPGGIGQSSADASGKFDPMSPLNGANGPSGGPGGAGGSFELRCYSLASSVALAVDVSGGIGGNGLDAQDGAKGGKGGDGGLENRGGVPWPNKGGNGGRGGNGGTGGIPGEGGAPGSISIWLLNGSANAITCALDAGDWGGIGNGGKPGAGGDAGSGGHVVGSRNLDGQRGADGRAGGSVDPRQFTRGHPSKAAVTTPCGEDALVDRLTLPLTPYLSMMLDSMRADYLTATADTRSTGEGAERLQDLADRLEWVTTLAAAYQPIDPKEEGALDAVRARIQSIKEHLSRGLDYFGHTPAFAPLGSLALYRGQFEADLRTLRQVWNDYNENVSALDEASASEQQLTTAQARLTDDQSAYVQGQQSERETIEGLVRRIQGHDSDVIAAKAVLVKDATDEFRQAVKAACGLKLEDLIDVVGQFAFLGEKQLQKGAMVISQTAKLINTATANCLEDDGTRVPKAWVLGQLHAVDDLEGSLTGYSGTIDGIKVSDPGAVKLLGLQAHLDGLCEKFWSYPGARELKVALDDYVSAVQARNADILAVNESLALLRGYIAGEAQSKASLTEVENAKSELSAPGAPALITQLARMVTRATDACIRDLYDMSRAYWMWSLQPGDELATQLTDIAWPEGKDDPLAITPDVLASAAAGLAGDYTTLFTRRLKDAGGWFPHPDHDGVWWPPPGARGICVEFTHDTHPAFIEALRQKQAATVSIAAPGTNTQVTDSPFAGYADIRLVKVRPWIFGARLGANPVKRTIRVDVTHTGRETIMSPEDRHVAIVTHDPVFVSFEFDPNRPDDPDAIGSPNGELFDLEKVDPDEPDPACLIGPFTRWRLTIPKTGNDPSLDISGIDKVVFEFFGHLRPYVTSKTTAAQPMTAPARA